MARGQDDAIHRHRIRRTFLYCMVADVRLQLSTLTAFQSYFDLCYFDRGETIS